MHRGDALNLRSRQQEKEQKDQLLHILRHHHHGLAKDQDPVVQAAQAVPAVVHVQAEVLTAAGDVN